MAGRPRKPSSLYLSAPLNALLRGIYREPTPVSSLLERGDFGLGTFNDLDGEMVVLDGEVFQARSDGRILPVSPETLTPFAAVTFFRPDGSETLDGRDFSEDLEGLLARLIPSRNMLYAVRVEGEFVSVRVRSVPRQETSRPLVEVAQGQPEFEFAGVRGTLVGFFTPDFIPSLSVPGFHLHFLDLKRERGGHLLAARPARVTVSLQHVPELVVGLPLSLAYLTADLSGDDRAEIDRAER